MLKKVIFIVLTLTILIDLKAQNVYFADAAYKQIADITADTSVYIAVNTILPEYKGNETVRVDVIPGKEYCTFMVSDGTKLENEGNVSYVLHYPIKLENDAVFTHKAFVEDIAAVNYILNKISGKSNVPEKCGVFTVENECVKFACLSEKDGEAYKAYCPLFGDKNSKVEIIKRNKIWDYILQSINNNSHKIYSIIRVGNFYLVKEFEE